MKIKCLLLLIFISIYADCSNKRSSICRWPITLAYQVVNIVAHSDFATLAAQGSTWRLAEKIRREGTGNIDKYYLRLLATIGNTQTLIYLTPLHEAVIEGNLEAVKFLCRNHADMTKKVLNTIPQSSDFSTESSPIQCISSAYDKVNRNNSLEDVFHVGRTAYEMADKLALTSEDKISKRAKIVNYLSKCKKTKRQQS